VAAAERLGDDPLADIAGRADQSELHLPLPSGPPLLFKV
jgi:hypothetical protein